MTGLVRETTTLSCLSTEAMPPGLTIQQLYEAKNIPAAVPVVCMMQRLGDDEPLPVLRRDGGWDIVPEPDAQLSFVRLPLGGQGGGGFKGFLRTVLLVRAYIAAAVLSFVLPGIGYQFVFEPLPVVADLFVISLVGQNSNDVQHRKPPFFLLLVPLCTHLM